MGNKSVNNIGKAISLYFRKFTKEYVLAGNKIPKNKYWMAVGWFNKNCPQPLGEFVEWLDLQEDYNGNFKNMWQVVDMFGKYRQSKKILVESNKIKNIDIRKYGDITIERLFEN